MLQDWKLIIFDMDGLLFDTERMYIEMTEKYAASLGMHIQRQVMLDSIGTDHMDVEHLLPDAPAGYDVRAFLRESWQRFGDALLRNGPPLKPGVLQLLDFLEEHNIPKVVATTTRSERALQLLRHAGILDRFAHAVCGDHVAHVKPAPDLFLLVLKEAQAEKQGALILEDSLNGARAARAAGVPCVVIPDMIQPTEDVQRSAFAILPSLLEVPALLQSRAPQE